MAARDGPCEAWRVDPCPAGAGRGVGLGEGLGRVSPAGPAGEDGRIPRRGLTLAEVRQDAGGWVPVAATEYGAHRVVEVRARGKEEEGGGAKAMTSSGMVSCGLGVLVTSTSSLDSVGLSVGEGGGVTRWDDCSRFSIVFN